MITQQKEAEETIQNRENLFRSILEGTNDGFMVLEGEELIVTFFSKSAELLLGKSADETLQKPLFNVFTEARGSVFEEKYKKAFQTQQALTFETHFEIEPYTNWYEVKVFPIGNGISVFFQITTQEKADKRALEKSRADLRSYIDNAPQAVFITDSHGKYIDTNPAATALTGFQKEEILTLSVGSLVHPDSMQLGLEHFQEVKENGFATGAFRYIKKDGSSGWWEVNASKVSDDRFIGFCNDVTSRKKAEEALFKQQQIIKIYNEIATIFLTGTHEKIFAEVLEVLLKTLKSNFGYFGYINDHGDLVCPSMTYNIWDACQVEDKDIIFPKDSWGGMWGNSLKQQISILKNGELIVPQGHIPLTSAMAVPIIHQNELIGQIGLANKHNGYSQQDLDLVENAVKQIAPVLNAMLIEDRQKRKHEQLEEQYRQSQKMEAVGRLAGGVAHDFNNHLTIINNYTNLIMADLPEADPIKEDLQQIVEAGERAVKLTRQLLAFSRKQVMQLVSLDINQVIVDIESMLKRLLGEDIEFNISLDDNIQQINADINQIEQVLLNLVINARDAMPKGGALTITTSTLDNIKSLSKSIPDSAVIKPYKQFVVLSVADTGEGMSDNIQEHIFEPFFTTKEKGLGTGLGLATVYGIVLQSEGFITVDSKIGQGSTFHIYFPVIEETNQTSLPASAEYTLEGNETILLVEDERAVRNLAYRILSTAGYKVIAAANGPEALHMAAEIDSPIDLLLTDVVMPKMSGKELADQLTAQYSDIKVLFMSGYTDSIIAKHGVLEKGINLLSKPFNVNQLLQNVRKAIEITSL